MFVIETVINGIKINYIKQGTGKNVLILPGWGTTISTYMSLINDISTYATVYCLDMPGFGKSDEPKEMWNLDKFIDFIIDFINSQGIQELDLIGHSNGGRIIIKLMSRKLNFKVNKIVLIGSAGIVHKKSFSQKFKIKYFKLGKKFLSLRLIRLIFPNAIENFKNRFGSEDYKNASPIMRQCMVSLINEDLKEYLPNVKAPTLLIWGEKDTATPIEDAVIMEKLIPDSGLVKVPECSHYVFLEKPGYINLVINTFLNGGKNV